MWYARQDGLDTAARQSSCAPFNCDRTLVQTCLSSICFHQHDTSPVSLLELPHAFLFHMSLSNCHHHTNSTQSVGLVEIFRSHLLSSQCKFLTYHISYHTGRKPCLGTPSSRKREIEGWKGPYLSFVFDAVRKNVLGEGRAGPEPEKLLSAATHNGSRRKRY